MSVHIIKNIFFAIIVSIILCPIQILAAEKTLETLHSRPKQTEPVQREKSQTIILDQSKTPIVLDPLLIDPQTPSITDPTIDIPIVPDGTTPDVVKPEIIVPEIEKPELTIPQEDKKSSEEKLTNILDFTQDKPESQEEQLSDELKDKPSQTIVPMSLTDFLIQTTKEDQKTLADENDKIKPEEPAPTDEKIAPKEDMAKEEPPKIEPPKIEPPKIEPPKIEPPKEEKPKEEPNKDEQKKGDPLKIPEEAKETGNLDFLEGCWVGNRPEYQTKRMITERFCFNDKGIGKRYIIDPQYAGTCVGSTRALVKKDGLLHMKSERMYCSPSGKQWGASDMQCQGEGEKTPCKWVFKNLSGATQAYTINFVRE